MSKVTQRTVAHVAQLAQLPLSEQKIIKLTADFNSILETIQQLTELEVTNIPETHQLTGFTNVWREDTVDEKRMFTQAQALSNASKTHKGMFVVPQLISKE